MNNTKLIIEYIAWKTWAWFTKGVLKHILRRPQTTKVWIDNKTMKCSKAKVIPQPDLKDQKCHPANACATHGRCWTHSEDAKCTLCECLPCEGVDNNNNPFCSAGCAEEYLGLPPSK